MLMRTDYIVKDASVATVLPAFFTSTTDAYLLIWDPAVWTSPRHTCKRRRLQLNAKHRRILVGERLKAARRRKVAEIPDGRVDHSELAVTFLPPPRG